MRGLIATLLIGFALVGPALAQSDDCPVREQAAFAEAQVWCSDLNPGEACVGNAPLRAEDAAGDGVALARVGDRLPVGQVARIIIPPEEGYGVAVVSAQAFQVGAWQTESLRLAAFGAAEVRNLAGFNEGDASDDAAVIASVQAAEGANIRSGPGEEFRVLGQRAQFDLVMLTGRSADGGWLRLQQVNGEPGWLVADAVLADTGGLPTVSREDAAPAPLYTSFSAVGIITPAFDARCQTGPPPGVLLQTETTNLLRTQINDIPVIFGGTLFVQASETRLMLYIIEGQAIIAPLTENEPVEAQASQRVEVIFPAEDAAEDVTVLAMSPTTYDHERLLPLPLGLLPRFFYIGLDISRYIEPRPTEDISPLTGMLVTDPCRITVGPGGANLRAGPGTQYPVRGVMAQRESAAVSGRAVGTDGGNWWQIAPQLWISATTTVTGGDCVAVPLVDQVPPLPPPTE